MSYTVAREDLRAEVRANTPASPTADGVRLPASIRDGPEIRSLHSALSLRPDTARLCPAIIDYPNSTTDQSALRQRSYWTFENRRENLPRERAV